MHRLKSWARWTDVVKAGKRGTSRFVTLILVCSSAAAFVSSAAPAVAAETAPTIDLATPLADIDDPAASLVPVDTNCAPGQVDLNTATVSRLEEALSISSKPTVHRLISMRPWLKGADLSSVPGIGPDRAAKLVPKTCATHPDPTTMPLRACTSTSQIDLNSAPAAKIQSALGLPTRAVDALIAARPLPQNLSQVVAPRVPGFTQPEVDALTEQGKICVTPSPYVGGKTVYRWISPSGGAVVRNDGFALIVPPGRVTGVGAYGGVTPMDPVSGVLPRADYHIYGEWHTNTTTIAVQGPYVAAGAPGGPLVLHDAADEMRMSIGAGTTVSMVDGQPTVTALATSLSNFTYGYAACDKQTSILMGGSLICIKDLSDGSLKRAWLDNAAAAGRAAGKSLSEKLHCPGAGTGHVVDGTLPYGMACQGDFDPGTGEATWTMTNEAYVDAAAGLVNAAVIYNYSLSGGQYHDPPALTGGAESNYVLKLLIDGMSQRLQWIFAGQTLHVSKPQGFVSTTAHVHSDPLATATWNGLTNVLSVIGAKGQGPLATAIKDLQLVDTLRGCITDLSKDSLGCLKGVVGQAADYLASPEAAKRFALSTVDTAAYATASSVLRWMAALQWAGSFLSSIAFQHIGGTYVTLSNKPPAPLRDGEGRLVNADCLSHDDSRWVIDEGCQDAEYSQGDDPVPGSGGGATGLPAGKIVRDAQGHTYFANQTDMTIAPIGLGSTYLCLAKHYIVDWNYDPLGDQQNRYSDYRWITGEPACDADAPPTTAVTEPNNVQSLTVLREPDGTAWFVYGEDDQGNETRVPVTTGEDFNCAVTPAPGVIESDVWDQVTPDQLANYPISTDVEFLGMCPGGF